MAAMVVDAAATQKKKNVKASQFSPVPIGNSIRYGRHIANTQQHTYQLYIDTHQWISASKHTEHVKPSFQ